VGECSRKWPECELVQIPVILAPYAAIFVDSIELHNII
jgi:hypothetical protein